MARAYKAREFIYSKKGAANEALRVARVFNKNNPNATADTILQDAEKVFQWFRTRGIVSD